MKKKKTQTKTGISLLLRKNNLIVIIEKIVNADTKQMLHLDKLRYLRVGLTGFPLVHSLSGYANSASKLILSDFLEFSEFHKFFFKGHFLFSFISFIFYLCLYYFLELLLKML